MPGSLDRSLQNFLPPVHWPGRVLVEGITAFLVTLSVRRVHTRRRRPRDLDAASCRDCRWWCRSPTCLPALPHGGVRAVDMTPGIAWQTIPHIAAPCRHAPQFRRAAIARRRGDGGQRRVAPGLPIGPDVALWRRPSPGRYRADRPACAGRRPAPCPGDLATHARGQRGMTPEMSPTGWQSGASENGSTTTGLPVHIHALASPRGVAASSGALDHCRLMVPALRTESLERVSLFLLDNFTTPGLSPGTLLCRVPHRRIGK